MACTLFSGTAVPVNQIRPATVTSLATVPANLPTTPVIARTAPESPGPSHQEVIVKKTPPRRQLLDLDPGVDDPFPNDDIAYDTINTQELISNDEVLTELTVPVVKSNILPEGSTVLAKRPEFKKPNQTIQNRSPAKKMRTPLRDIGNESQNVTKGTLLFNYDYSLLSMNF